MPGFDDPIEDVGDLIEFVVVQIRLDAGGDRHGGMPHRLLQPPQVRATRTGQRGVGVAQIVNLQRRPGPVSFRAFFQCVCRRQLLARSTAPSGLATAGSSKERPSIRAFNTAATLAGIGTVRLDALVFTRPMTMTETFFGASPRLQSGDSRSRLLRSA